MGKRGETHPGEAEDLCQFIPFLPKGRHTKTNVSPQLSCSHKPIFVRATGPPVRSSFKASNQDFNLLSPPKTHIVAASQQSLLNGDKFSRTQWNLPKLPQSPAGQGNPSKSAPLPEAPDPPPEQLVKGPRRKPAGHPAFLNKQNMSDLLRPLNALRGTTRDTPSPGNHI